MKSRCCALSFLLLYACASKGQCPSNWGQLELAASYGIISSAQVSDNFTVADNSSGTKKRTSVSGNSFMSARYFLFNRLALGLSAGTGGEKGQVNDRAVPTLIASTYTRSTTTFAMELCYIYHFAKHLEIYTLTGFGPSFTTTSTAYATGPNAGATLTSKEDKIRAQYSPVGIRVGNRLAGFAEIGVGYKGVINGGISYKFGSSCWWKQ